MTCEHVRCQHEIIEQGIKDYVNGLVYTNGIESFRENQQGGSIGGKQLAR